MTYIDNNGKRYEIGDEITVRTRMEDFFSTYYSSVTRPLTEEYAEKLVKRGLLKPYRKLRKVSSFVKDSEINLEKAACVLLSKQGFLHPYSALVKMCNADVGAAYSFLLKVCAKEMDKKYPDYITEAKEWYAVEKPELKVIKFNVPKTRSTAMLVALFRSPEEAHTALALVNKLLGELADAWDKFYKK
jgi:hypothetical protein